MYNIPSLYINIIFYLYGTIKKINESFFYFMSRGLAYQNQYKDDDDIYQGIYNLFMTQQQRRQEEERLR